MAGTYLTPLAQKCKSVPWRWLAFGLIAFPAWIVLCIATVRAQEMPCVKDFSDEKFAAATGEIPVIQGVTAQGALFRVFANPKTGAFTVLLRMGEATCGVDTGEGFEFVVPKGLENPA